MSDVVLTKFDLKMTKLNGFKSKVAAISAVDDNVIRFEFKFYILSYILYPPQEQNLIHQRELLR